MIALIGAAGFVVLALGNLVRAQPTIETRSDDTEVVIGRQARTESLETLPRWLTSDQYARGPVSAETLLTNKEDTTCYSIGEVLSAVPELSKAMELFKDAGYTKTLLNDRKVMGTVVVPVNAAFSAPLEANEYGANMSAIISERPDIMGSLVGASVWKGLWTSDTFSRRGTKIPTSNKLGSEGEWMIVEAFSGSGVRGGAMHVEAHGSDAAVIVSDLAACGPSVVHVVDSILLPFDWDDGARDRTRLEERGGLTVGGWGWGGGGGGGNGWGWGFG